MRSFELKIQDNEFSKYSENYKYQTDSILVDVVRFAKENHYLNKELFLKICKWKTPRSQPLCASNSEAFIKEITNIALTTNSDQLRIEILTILKGVSWPTASAILHFCHNEAFPILDFRALYTLGFNKVPRYNYAFWEDYTNYCRKLGKQFNTDLRDVDRALWQYSKENQN